MNNINNREWPTGNQYTRDLMHRFAEIELPRLSASESPWRGISSEPNTGNEGIIKGALLYDGHLLNVAGRQLINSVVDVGIQGLGLIPSMIYDIAMAIFHASNGNFAQASNHLISCVFTPFRALIVTAKDLSLTALSGLGALVYNAVLISVIAVGCIPYALYRLYQ